MISKRVKQFYINVTDLMKKEDYEYVEKILDNEEYNIFIKLLKSEQKHSVRIAKDIENIIENKLIQDEEIINNKELLIKVALLHDIGKTRKKLNVFDKSIIVILNNLTDGKLKNIKRSKKVQCYYNHSEYSYEILKKMNEEEALLDIVRYHHSDEQGSIIEFFKSIDDKN